MHRLWYPVLNGFVWLYFREKSPELKMMAKGFALCVAYGANIGGIATLTGTPPNLVLQGQADMSVH